MERSGCCVRVVPWGVVVLVLFSSTYVKGVRCVGACSVMYVEG